MQSNGPAKSRESQLGSLGTKCHLDVSVVERHKIYYKGEGGGFPPSSSRGESVFARGSS